MVHKTTTDDKKLQSNLKKLGVNNIPGIEEVNMMKEDGNVIHFTNPKGEVACRTASDCVLLVYRSAILFVRKYSCRKVVVGYAVPWYQLEKK